MKCCNCKFLNIQQETSETADVEHAQKLEDVFIVPYKTYIKIIKNGKPVSWSYTPAYYYCDKKGFLKHNWNIYKERKCEHFRQITNP
jgi:hypothetical protein